jgi:hypothetical protein
VFDRFNLSRGVLEQSSGARHFNAVHAQQPQPVLGADAVFGRWCGWVDPLQRCLEPTDTLLDVLAIAPEPAE